MLLGASNVNKDTERKRVFSSANVDFIQLPTTYNIHPPTGATSYVEIKFKPTVGFDQQDATLFGVNTTSDPLIYIQNSTRIRINTDSSNSFPLDYLTGFNLNQSYVIRIEFDGTNATLFVDGNLEDTRVVPSGNLNIERVGRRRSLTNALISGEVEYFDLDGELFNLNEGNGAAITGSAGTVATVNTSHAGGLNYINQEVIQPIYGEGKQRKRVLTDSNGDYISLPSTTSLVNQGDYIEFEFELNQAPVASTITIMSNGLGSYVSFLTAGNVYFDNTANGEGSFSIFGEGNQTSNVLRIEIAVSSIDITINGTTYNRTQITNFDLKDFFNRNVNFYSGSVKRIEINGESFSCNEGNGADIVGSAGTVATVNTSHAGGLNYINHEVIKTIQ